jgi:type I restriction enzyme M protein
MVSNKATSDIVGKLWSLCNILKDDGVTFHQYVIELTYLLFLKMADETGSDAHIPKNCSWKDLVAKPAPTRLTHYKLLLATIANSGSKQIKEIFSNASTFIKKANSLSVLVTEIDKLEWYSVHREDLGDLYEGLLEKNASEKKSGAGQYFTPRVLIDSMVAVMKPNLSDVIQDPAAGTGGFLIAANHYLRLNNDFKMLTERQRKKFRSSTFTGMEHVQDTHRLALMNLMLHDIDGGIHYGDTLSQEGQGLPKASLILTNPPFGAKKGGGLPTRTDLPFPTSNKQLAFLQLIYNGLKAGGRAAVILPDNVLFENNLGLDIRRDLMEKCNLHTILRLPTGIFYAQGVKTNVLFFTRAKSKKNNTTSVWVYDLRTNMPQFGKRNKLTKKHFEAFEDAFGNDPTGEAVSTRKDLGDQGRFRCFTREQIAMRGDSLDFSWLKEELSTDSEDLSRPTVLAQQAVSELEAALEDLKSILEELNFEIES